MISQKIGTERMDGGNPVLMKVFPSLPDSPPERFIPLPPSMKIPFKLTQHLINTAFHLLSRFFSESQGEDVRQGDSVVREKDKAEPVTENAGLTRPWTRGDHHVPLIVKGAELLKCEVFKYHLTVSIRNETSLRPPRKRGEAISYSETLCFQHFPRDCGACSERSEESISRNFGRRFSSLVKVGLRVCFGSASQPLTLLAMTVVM